VVSTSADLTSALANTAVGHIVLAPGTYNLIAELSITRSVVLEAAVAGSVILNAQASSSSERRVVSINLGPSGVVQLIGLNITGGYTTSYVRAHVQNVPSSNGKIADVLASTLACITAAYAFVNYSTPVNYSGTWYVPQRPEFSQGPDGRFADALASTLACAPVNASVTYTGGACNGDLKAPNNFPSPRRLTCLP
jgi:hypothetical protein